MLTTPDTWFRPLSGGLHLLWLLRPVSPTLHRFNDLPKLTFTELGGFHRAFATGLTCQQGALTLPDTWFRPPFWDLLILPLLRPNSSNLPCPYSTFHLKYLLVLSRFSFDLTTEYTLFPHDLIKQKIISISTSQTFRSWVVIFHLRRPVAFFFFISQLIRYARACTSYECFILRARRLSSKLFKQGYLLERLKSSFRKFYGRYGDLIQPYESSRITNDILTLEQQGLPNRSDFPTISWPWYRAWPSQNFEWFPWSICKGCGMPAGNAYPSEHLVPSPFLELSYAPVVETRFLEISMSLLDFSPWIPFGNFSILRLIGISIESQKRTSVLQTKLAFSSNKIYDSCKCWTCADYCEVFTFLMKKIYMQFRCILYKQIMWICMLTNCAPLKEERHIALHMSVGRSVCRNVGIP